MISNGLERNAADADGSFPAQAVGEKEGRHAMDPSDAARPLGFHGWAADDSECDRRAET
jgi:hypothetical protein